VSNYLFHVHTEQAKPSNALPTNDSCGFESIRIFMSRPIGKYPSIWSAYAQRRNRLPSPRLEKKNKKTEETY